MVVDHLDKCRHIYCASCSIVQLPPFASLSLSDVENCVPFNGMVTKGSVGVMPVNPPIVRGYSLLSGPTPKVL